MYAPLLRMPSFEDLEDRDRRSVLLGLLRALTTVDVSYLRRRLDAPWLYGSGVRYVEKVPCIDGSCECWQDVQLTWQSKAGNCKELSSWRIAELLVRRNEHASHVLSLQTTDLGGGQTLHTYHVRVRRADGSIEDPSVRLGMR
jgi:hypothetical protein